MKKFDYRNQKFISALVKVGSYLAIFYIIFLIVRVVWTNYNLRGSIKELENQIATLNQDKKDLENLNSYYQSESFKELEARKKLGLKASGEKVLVLAATPTAQNFSEELKKEKEGTAVKNPENLIPNWAMWWEYFTK